ncbi:MAG: type II toxin-antitoxin system HicB family antitoxin [Chloroflexi bacterium]|nr:type II toxin-antitoxin system HicB family antitoxin [Chloroflexota bacterium]
MLKYKVILERNEDDEGFYTVTVPALPGCVTQGRTKKEALIRAKEAIEGYLESLQKDGLPVPEDVELAEVSISQ